MRARGRAAALAIALVLAGCGPRILQGSAPAPTLTLSIRNEATSRVLVRWTGPASGDTAIEACDLFEMPLGLGAWRFDLRSSTDQVTLPIGVEPSDVGLTFIGIDEEGRIAIGRPPDNPRCANQ